MYVLMVYDVQAKYCGKVLSIARKYLDWTQNSVLEGELTTATYKKMIKDLNSRVKLKEIGSVVLYSWPCEKYVKKDFLGKNTASESCFI